jgi:hypothetical protein
VELTGRDWATIAWVGFFAALLLRQPSGRKSVRELVELLLSPKVLLPFVLFAVWMSGSVLVAARIGAWSPAF